VSTPLVDRLAGALEEIVDRDLRPVLLAGLLTVVVRWERAMAETETEEELQ